MYEGIVQDLIDEFARLPGVGPKSAQRIAFHIVQTRISMCRGWHGCSGKCTTR